MEWELARKRMEELLGYPSEELATKPSLPPSEPGKLLPEDLPNVQPPTTGI